MVRKATASRTTKETSISISINLDGTGKTTINTGIGMFDHLLEQIAVHGSFDLEARTKGDLHIDTHHVIEDVAIVLGKAIKQALGDKKGITRVGSCYQPMDESLVLVAIDISNRPYLVLSEIPWHGSILGSQPSIPTTMIEHFLYSLAINAGITLHIKVLYGKDDHHIAEAIFKAFGRALDSASRIDPKRNGALPSSKGNLSDDFSSNNTNTKESKS